MHKKTLLAVTSLALSGCTVTYLAEPANEIISYTGEICVIQQHNVRSEFIQAYAKQLKARGFSFKLLSSDSVVTDCKITSTYTGKWSWDFKTYMATAKITIFQDGEQIGEATYSAPRAGFALTTKIYESTETKISEMLNKLFPDS